jgi:hypothetical protein
MGFIVVGNEMSVEEVMEIVGAEVIEDISQYVVYSFFSISVSYSQNREPIYYRNYAKKLSEGGYYSERESIPLLELIELAKAHPEAKVIAIDD